jgi:predicted Zn-dependent protease
MAILAVLPLLAAQPAAAQSVSVLRDAETEALFQDMVDPIAEAAGLGKGNVDVVLLYDNSINAQTAGGQRIYINSGLIGVADTANEVQGVMAHEMGHIVGGHSIGIEQGLQTATRTTIISMLLGIAAAVAGAGDAAMGVMAAGQTAAYGKLLAFSRVQEESADAAGVKFLSKAGISGRGSISFFKKLENYEYRYGYSHDEEETFVQSHPLTPDRIAALEHDYEQDPAWNTPPDPKLQARFELVKAKLYGYLAKPADTLKFYPPTMDTLPAHYARAYAFHKDARLDQALDETRVLLAADPSNPYFLELKGQILLEAGKPADALAPLREATRLTNNQPLIAGTFGHALIATEDPANYDEAERVLKAAVTKDRENPDAWYQLGVVYAARGDLPRARLASAEQQAMTGQMLAALQSASAAERMLPADSPDALRAQDIELVARAALEQQKKHK